MKKIKINERINKETNKIEFKIVCNEYYIFHSINILVLVIIFVESFYIKKYYTLLKRFNNRIDDEFNSTNLYNSSNDNSTEENISLEEVIKNSKEYLFMCRNGSLIHKEPFVKYKEPTISVIVSVYNYEKGIKSTIRSIQNQNMLDIEIILINDCSTDNTKQIIEELMKEDPRIKLINNSKNMGLLYSRSIGTLEASGKYIITLDSDDSFCAKDLFSKAYKATDNEYFDIISFKTFTSSENLDFKVFFLTDIRNKKNQIVYQPQLGIFPVYGSHPIYNNHVLIWGKLIKTYIFKAAVNLLGKERYSNFVIWGEDTTLFFLISTISESFKFIEKIGLIHFQYKGSTSLSLPPGHSMYGEIFLLDVIFDFSKNENKKYAAHKLIEIKGKPHFSLKFDKNKEYLKYVVRKIMNCDYIDQNDKNSIKKAYQGVDIFS